MSGIATERVCGSLLTRRNAAMWLLAVIASGTRGTVYAQAANSAETFVQSNIDRSYGILNHGALSASERQLQFRALLLSIVDMRRVALFTLGPYARDAAQTTLDQFESALADLVTAIYLRGLTSYSGLAVTGSTERSRDDVIVNVAAARGDGNSSPVSIGFRVRRAVDGRQVITDLQIEGAWLAIQQRSEFMAYLQQHGGDIAALSLELERTAARIRPARSETELDG